MLFESEKYCLKKEYRFRNWEYEGNLSFTNYRAYKILQLFVMNIFCVDARRSTTPAWTSPAIKIT